MFLPELRRHYGGVSPAVGVQTDSSSCVPHGRENRKAAGQVDDDDDLDDGKSYASFVSGMSNTSVKLRKLDSIADESLMSYARLNRSNTSTGSDAGGSKSGLGAVTGGALGKLGFRGSSIKANARKSRSVTSFSSYNTLVGLRQNQLRAKGVWVPKVRERERERPSAAAGIVWMRETEGWLKPTVVRWRFRVQTSVRVTFWRETFWCSGLL